MAQNDNIFDQKENEFMILKNNMNLMIDIICKTSIFPAQLFETLLLLFIQRPTISADMERVCIRRYQKNTRRR